MVITLRNKAWSVDKKHSHWLLHKVIFTSTRRSSGTTFTNRKMFRDRRDNKKIFILGTLRHDQTFHEHRI